MTVTIRRRFADLPWGQIHYREAGTGGPAPLVMVHGAAGSSKTLEPLQRALAGSRRTLSLDMPGAGDSSTPNVPEDQADAAWFANVIVEAMDAIGIDKFDLYGAHLGVRLGTELGITRPDRLRRAVLDGSGFYTPQELQDMVDHVAPAYVPDMAGTHLIKAWAYVRDYFVFYPWFQPKPEFIRGTGLPSADTMHEKVIEVLKNGRTYGICYRAGLRYPLAEKLPQVKVPVLLACGKTDNVIRSFEHVRALLPDAPSVVTPGAMSPEAIAETVRMFDEFLDGPA